MDADLRVGLPDLGTPSARIVDFDAALFPSTRSRRPVSIVSAGRDQHVLSMTRFLRTCGLNASPRRFVCPYRASAAKRTRAQPASHRTAC